MKVFLSLLLSMFCFDPLFGQDVSLRGVITDESGAVVPGATVIIGVAGAAHADYKAVRLQFLDVRLAAVLYTAVRVMDDARLNAAVGQRSIQRA
jgi:hypothetical protein